MHGYLLLFSFEGDKCATVSDGSPCVRTADQSTTYSPSTADTTVVSSTCVHI